MSGVKLMAHMVAGYPDLEKSLAVAGALAAGGADYLEVQFPFSDPSADGPVIEKACHAALAAGFKVDAGFELLERIAGSGTVPVFVMTYASLVFARGVERFVRDAAAAGAAGLIVPDLPPDYDEGLYRACAAAGLSAVPVLSPAMPEARFDLIRKLEPKYVYTALRAGVTGSATALDAATLAYLDRVGKLGAKIIAGFGVRSRDQMLTLFGKAHAVAVGSHFLAEMAKAGGDPQAARDACRELKG